MRQIVLDATRKNKGKSKSPSRNYKQKDIYSIQRKAYESYVKNYKNYKDQNPYFDPKFRPHSSHDVI